MAKRVDERLTDRTRRNRGLVDAVSMVRASGETPALASLPSASVLVLLLAVAVFLLLQPLLAEE